MFSIRVRTRAAWASSPTRRGLMVTRCRARQRPVSSAKPRSPRQRGGPVEGVVGLVVGGEDLPADGLLDRCRDALTCAVVAGVGQCGQVESAAAVRGG